MKRDGYTLIELVVTIMIVGVLAAYGVPQYLQSVETAKADDAVAIVNMIGTTNRMFALDHGGNYVRGNFAAACGTGGACNAGALTTACTLVNCKYLADQDWANKPYTFDACDGTAAGNCGAGLTATGRRGGGAIAPYSTWRYDMDRTGAISANGTNPPPPTY